MAEKIRDTGLSTAPSPPLSLTVPGSMIRSTLCPTFNESQRYAEFVFKGEGGGEEDETYIHEGQRGLLVLGDNDVGVGRAIPVIEREHREASRCGERPRGGGGGGGGVLGDKVVGEEGITETN